jgi:hypothetical protein
MRQLDWAEVKERIDDMRQAAVTIKLYASIMFSPNPNKQKAIEKMREATETILECLDTLEAMPEG